MNHVLFRNRVISLLIAPTLVVVVVAVVVHVVAVTILMLLLVVEVQHISVLVHQP